MSIGIDSILPYTRGGKLPYWLLFISIVSIFNSFQSYQRDLALTRRVYNAKPQEVTNLSARTFGTWTLITSLVRLYGAYNITNPQVYTLTQLTYVVAAWHFLSEWLIYGTTKLGKGLAGPLIVSSLSLVWMWNVKSYYVF
ncbi:ergosterol biosynthesis protein [Lodderomyces elongisporus]|uniref:ergosterol biosynthesis protein n=1 Tax=Lodderomyces elongisporus TaxID=36914 RepID=UPI00291E9AC2|nr:ergosterol biosynthesis protein [Lodderomyces elongisporus]WLF77419.1 ergosterol biosynthesis protein [Lodderomyces elongisporus]